MGIQVVDGFSGDVLETYFRSEPTNMVKKAMKEDTSTLLQQHIFYVIPWVFQVSLDSSRDEGYCLALRDELEDTLQEAPPETKNKQIISLKDDHPFLNYFKIPDSMRAAFRRILSFLMHVAESDHPEMWILQDDSLLWEFIFARVSRAYSISTIRNDLVVLCSALNNCSHPQYNPREHTLTRLRAYLNELRQPKPEPEPRKTSQKLTEQLRSSEDSLIAALGELELSFSCREGPVSVYRNALSSPWLTVTQYLGASVGRMIGVRALPR